nr:MAG TPA: hypothetical protein [Caudoviricetes sp.]
MFCINCVCVITLDVLVCWRYTQRECRMTIWR